MKSNPSRLLLNLHQLVRFFFFLFCILGLLNVFLTISRFSGSDKAKVFWIEVPVDVSPEIIQSEQSDALFQHLKLRNTTGQLGSDRLMLSQRILLNLPTWLMLGLGLASLYQIMQLLGSLRTSHPFIHSNYLRLRRFAWLILACSIVKAPFYYLTSRFASNHATFDNIRIDPMLGNFDFMLLFIGLAVLVIADVFRAGIEMKEDQDLTV